MRGGALPRLPNDVPVNVRHVISRLVPGDSPHMRHQELDKATRQVYWLQARDVLGIRRRVGAGRGITVLCHRHGLIAG